MSSLASRTQLFRPGQESVAYPRLPFRARWTTCGDPHRTHKSRWHLDLWVGGNSGKLLLCLVEDDAQRSGAATGCPDERVGFDDVVVLDCRELSPHRVAGQQFRDRG